MRIIAGRFGGRRFQPPAKMPARPTTDRAREGLFNVLAHSLDLETISFLDLFGGTGAVTYEMASRSEGARIVTVEQDAKLVAFIKKNVAMLGVEKQVSVLRMDVAQYIKSSTDSFDFILADPPYALPWLYQLPDLITAGNLLKPDGLLAVEHDHRNQFRDHPLFIRERNYGDAIFSFFAKNIVQNSNRDDLS